MDRPKRKENRLPEYDYSQPGCYFVTVCTANRGKCLSEIIVGADVLIGPQVQLSPCGQIVKDVLDHMPTVEKYVIMPDHLHILFRLNRIEAGPVRTPAPTQSLPMLVRYMKRRVTITYGKSIWQRGYHDHIIRDDKDYQAAWAYIDTNPFHRKKESH